MRRNVIDTYPRETVDFLPLVDVTVNGVPVTDPGDIEYAIVPETARPTTWSAVTDADGVIGFVLQGPTLGRGVFAVYVRPTSGSIRPVIPVGHVRLT